MKRKLYPGEVPEGWVGPDGKPVKRSSGTAKTIALVCLGVLIAFVGLIALTIALEDPEQRAARERAQAEQRAIDEDAEAERTKNEASAAESARKQTAIAWYQDILSVAQSCDLANDALSQQFAALGNGSTIYTAYEAASTARSLCSEAWSNMRNLDEPAGLGDAAEESAKKTIEMCGDAYFAKRQFAEVSMEVLDGDSRPSKLSEASEYGELSKAGTLACVASAIDTLGKAGVPLDEIPD